MKKKPSMIYNNKSGLFSYLILLTLTFIFFQIIFVLEFSNNPIVLSVALHNNYFKIPQNVWLDIFFYCFAQIIIYSIFTFGIWGITRLSAKLLKLSWQKTCLLGFTLWGFAIFASLLANQIYFPNSIFSQFSAVFIPTTLAKIFLWLIVVFIITISFVALINLLRLFWDTTYYIKIPTLISSIIIAGSLTIHFLTSNPSPTISNKPNVIIIGLDAVQPDRLEHYKYPYTHTPTINNFLLKSTDFTASLTPLARTFPAWVSILTGQYPKNNQVRFNLISQNNLRLNNTLAVILKKHSYQTFYATDDSRFSNITKHFGFDKVIGIKPGISDFILGSLNDFPLTNLIINTSLGRILFPYSYANRGADITYNPKSFISLIANQLSKRQQNKPLFLAVHLCLTHYPFIWSSLPIDKSPSNSKLYDLAIEEIDRQFAGLMQTLNHFKILDNAIVVLLSDHGESFGLNEDHLINPNNYIKGQFSDKNIFKHLFIPAAKKSRLITCSGHGTDVLSYTQYHNLLAFHYFGKKKNLSRKVSILTSLIDIKPTLLDILDIHSPDVDGISLKPYLENHNVKTKSRMIFCETGFTPLELKKSKVSIKNAVYEGIQAFQIEPHTGRIIMKPSFTNKLLATKQRAVFFGDWTLALYPNNNKQIPILINRKTKMWTDDLSIPFAKQSPAKKMLATLKTFYEQEDK